LSWHGTQFSYIVASLRVVDINQIGRKNLLIDKCDAKSVVYIYIYIYIYKCKDSALYIQDTRLLVVTLKVN